MGKLEGIMHVWTSDTNGMAKKGESTLRRKSEGESDSTEKRMRPGALKTKWD